MENTEIIIADLIEAAKIIKESEADGGEFLKELIAIDNAVNFLEGLKWKQIL